MIDNIEPRILIEKVAEKLKSVIDMPEWAKFVKTGVNRAKRTYQTLIRIYSQRCNRGYSAVLWTKTHSCNYRS